MCLVIRLIKRVLEVGERMLALTKEYNQTELELFTGKNVYKKSNTALFCCHFW